MCTKTVNSRKDPPCAYSTCTEEEHKVCERWLSPHQRRVHTRGRRKGRKEEAKGRGQAKEGRRETKKAEERKKNAEEKQKDAAEKRKQKEETEKKRSEEKQKRMEMRKRTAAKAKETPKNTQEGMLTANVTTSYWCKPFKLCSVSLTGTFTTQTVCEQMTCHHPKARSWIECEQCGAWHHCVCAGTPFQKASVTTFTCALCMS